MIKKLWTILLSLAMTLSLGICSFAEDEDSQSIIENFIEETLKQDSIRADIGMEKMNLDAKVSQKVDTDASLIIYKINVDKDTNVTLNYKSSSAIFGIGVTPYNLSRAILTGTSIDKIEKNISWLDFQTGIKSTPQGKVDLKLNKGENSIAVLATKGDYEFIAQTTTGDLKTMEEMKVDEIYQGATVIKGTALAGAEIKAICSTCENFEPITVNTDNTFELKITPAQQDEIYMITIKKDGYVPQVQWVQVTRNENFKTFTVNTVKSTSKYVTGKGEVGAKVTVATGDTQIGEATVKSDGTYSIKLPPKPQSGTVLKVTMKKEGFNTKTKTVTVKKVFTKKLTVNTVKSTSSYITGTGSPSATIKAYVGDKKIGETKVSSKTEKYSMKIAKQSKGKKITVKMYKTGFATSTKTVTVK